MCYDDFIIHIGALFQKGVCNLAEKRKDKVDASSKRERTSAKTVLMTIAIPIPMERYDVSMQRRWKPSAKRRKRFSVIWQMELTMLLVRLPCLN